MNSPLILDCVHGSREWLQARCGLVTASRCAHVTAMKKDKTEKAERADYRSELISEILTGNPYPHFVSKEMKWGLDQEPFARAAYEMQRDVLVATGGFFRHPSVDRFGASPDGLVGDDGLIQIKCPSTTTHIEWLLSGTVPVEHMPQMLGEMACTLRTWCDFVSYDPRLPEHLQLYVKRFHRDERFVALLEKEVQHFNREIDEQLAALPQKPQMIAEVLSWPIQDEVQL
jgi:putative phage-type endonuclease